MAPNAARLRALYRSLLRELPPRPILSSTSRSHIHVGLRTTFSSSSSPSSNSQAAQADQLITYLRAQRKYVNLIERYNPGMDMDEEERVRLTARRVGLSLPIEYFKPKGS